MENVHQPQALKLTYTRGTLEMRQWAIIALNTRLQNAVPDL